MTTHTFMVDGVPHILHQFNYDVSGRGLVWTISRAVDNEAELRKVYGTAWKTMRHTMVDRPDYVRVWECGDFVAQAIIEKLERSNQE